MPRRKKNEELNKKNQLTEEEEGEKLGSKLVIFFVTIFIILIWLGIIAILIKTDVGGFGSSVLSPVLKDVPYLNKILPEGNKKENDVEVDTQYPYDSIDEAVEQIKELELLLDEANAKNEVDSQTIADLQQQVAELSVYKEEEAAFEALKEKFYEEVVFSEEAPDIEEYKEFYESIAPANAEVLYQQVVEQVEQSEELKEYIKTYSAMKPKEAAGIFDTMTDNLGLVADILEGMSAEQRADILEQMNKDTAAKLTAIMEPEQ